MLGPLDAVSEAELLYPREPSSGPSAGAGTFSGAFAGAGAGAGADVGSVDGIDTGVGPASIWGVDREGSSRTTLFPEAKKEEPARRFRFSNGREILEERAFLVGVEVRKQGTPQRGAKGKGNQRKGGPSSSLIEEDSPLQRRAAKGRTAEASEEGRHSEEVGVEFPVEESLAELARLCDTAGLKVLGSTFQRHVTHPAPFPSLPPCPPCRAAFLPELCFSLCLQGLGSTFRKQVSTCLVFCLPRFYCPSLGP